LNRFCSTQNHRIIVLAGLTLCLLQLGVAANDIEPGKDYYSAKQNTIVVDGDLSDWGGATVWKDTKFYVPKGAGPAGTLVSFEVIGGSWTGPDDHTTAFAMVWDEQNLYVGLRVTDDYHENSAHSAWNGDALQVAFANSTRDTITHLYDYALGGAEDSLGDLIVLNEQGPGGTGASIRRDIVAKQTYYEIKFPASSLDLPKFEAGMQLGIGLCVNDGDRDAPGQKGWSGWGVHALVFGKTAEETGLVTLDGGTAASLEYKSEPANYITVDGNLSDWPGKELKGPTAFEIPKVGGGTVVYFEEAGGTWTGPQDHTSSFSIAWTTNALYLGVVVLDDYHEHADGQAWNGDALQILFANRQRDLVTHLYNYALSGIEGALGSVMIDDEQGPGGTSAAIVRDVETRRTYYEVKFPASSLGLARFEPGLQFGLGLCVNDGDADSPGQKGWSGWGVHALVFGKSPERSGLVTLVPAKAEPVLEFSAKPAGFITVDGRLDDWESQAFIGPVPFEIPKTGGGTVVLFEALSGDWTGPEDHTSVLSFAWEKDALYIGVAVTDDYHENAAKSAWEGDALQVAFANAARNTMTHLYDYGLGGIEGDLRDLVVLNEQGPGGTEAAITRNGVQTIYEIKIPPSALDLTEFTEGEQFGIGLCINDGDLHAPGQSGWSGWGVHAIVFGKSPERTGLVTLVDHTSKPQLSIALSPPNVLIRFTGILQESDKHSGGVWTDLGNAADLGGELTLAMPLPGTVRFYRSVRK
jgi:hypothetical protein